jgi:malate dehydrogenase (oxaloacetate-decarboxylating)(NADP+)
MRHICVPPQVFLVAAEALASMTSLEDLAHGYLFPPFSHIREVSAKLMAAVCAYMVDTGLGTAPESFTGDWEATCKDAMWDV